jgi:hypothetical protein
MSRFVNYDKSNLASQVGFVPIIIQSTPRSFGLLHQTKIQSTSSVILLPGHTFAVGILLQVLVKEDLAREDMVEETAKAYGDK